MVANDNYHLVHTIDRSKIRFDFRRHALRCDHCGRAVALEDAQEAWGASTKYILVCYPDCSHPWVDYEHLRCGSSKAEV